MCNYRGTADVKTNRAAAVERKSYYVNKCQDSSIYFQKQSLKTAGNGETRHLQKRKIVHALSKRQEWCVSWLHQEN